MKVVGQPSGKLIADAVREWSSNLGRRRGSLGRQPGVPGGCVRTPAARQALQRGPVIDAFSDDDEALTNHYHHQLPVSLPEEAAGTQSRGALSFLHLLGHSRGSRICVAKEGALLWSQHPRVDSLLLTGPVDMAVLPGESHGVTCSPEVDVKINLLVQSGQFAPSPSSLWPMKTDI